LGFKREGKVEDTESQSGKGALRAPVDRDKFCDKTSRPLRLFFYRKGRKEVGDLAQSPCSIIAIGFRWDRADSPLHHFLNLRRTKAQKQSARLRKPRNRAL